MITPPPTIPVNLHFDHAKAPLCSLDEGKLSGLRHRTVIDASVGATELSLWQEEHLPGFNVPDHLHDCEEIITVLRGRIEASISGKTMIVSPGESILIPAWAPHGFRVIGEEPIKLLAIFSSPDPRIFKPDYTPSLPPWAGGTARQFDE
jgi:quercetin dioxygenase-like cupin family protein